ncbi:hypothetical protein ACFQS3_08125 [Glycomyces mayteni]|uniref:Cytochrome P450 n=1 Tax=Glycomyces mayteni TaxID=543887 RepID=A0ABW2D7N6_9ACTN
MISFGADRAPELLADPGLVPPPAAPGPTGGLAWLRAGVARFASGEAHARRRALAADLLGPMDLDVLRLRAEILACIALEDAPLDVMDRIARDVPVRVLAEALDAPGIDPAAVRTIAAAYPAGDAAPGTDEAVAALVAAFGGVPDEPTAARIGLLVQACEATAALIGGTLAAGAGLSPDAIAARLRDDPPVSATFRTATIRTATTGTAAVSTAATAVAGLAPGEAVRIELDGAVPFGAGPHACPGRPQALAIATGVCEALQRVPPPAGPVAYEPLPNLRLPAAIRVEAPPRERDREQTTVEKPR